MLRKEVENCVGVALKSARFCKIGSLLVETYTFKQTRKLIMTDFLINSSVLIEVTVA